MKKLANRKGFTLVEMLACVVTLLLIVSICTMGMNFAMRSYNESVYESDAQMLESSLNLYICDILRHAVDIQVDESAEEAAEVEKTVTAFTNVNYQIYAGKIRLSQEDEATDPTYLVYETKNNSEVMIVGKNTYSNTLYITDFVMKYNKDKGYFVGSYTIRSTILENAARECTFTCRTITVYEDENH